ncbi:unnamed protein product [Ambrosiozyma monospora]|uniref:Unnamed protein product n=1 Tax=Ambrosiozyma monospora TaxID=43982 RepID=A0ACB5T7G0_AMBMO|nr:unnamed protein product [Ambrosiozyma monospora]
MLEKGNNSSSQENQVGQEQSAIEQKTNSDQQDTYNYSTSMFQSPINKLNAQFNIHYPQTKNRFFSPQFNKVKGEAKLKVLEDVDRIISIEVGLRGRCITKHIHCSVAKSNTTTSPAGGFAISQKEKHLLFEKTDVVFKTSDDLESMNKRRNNSGGHCCLKAGRKLKQPFSFEFPETIPNKNGGSGDDIDLELPSSCDNFGKNADGQATTTIGYETFIRVTYNTPFFKNTKTVEYFHRLNYQGGCCSSGNHDVSLGDWEADGVSSSAVFKENLNAGHLALNEDE